jgi:hypothetical protein
MTENEPKKTQLSLDLGDLHREVKIMALMRNITTSAMYKILIEKGISVLRNGPDFE